jgi:hypothetical protein
MPKKKLPKPITDIPPEEVGEVVQSFIDNDGVKRMDVNEQPDGLFTVTPKK